MLSGVLNMAAGASDRRVENETFTSSSLSHSNFPTNVSGLLWEEKPRTIRELISSYRLPLAVKLKSGYISLTEKENTVKDKNNKTNRGTSDTSDSFISINDGSTSNSNSSSGGSHSRTKSISNGQFPVAGESKDTSSHKPGLSEETIIQIHEMRRKKIILARKMTWEKRQNDYVVTGEQVEIPAAFKGWIEVVPDDGRPVEYFDTVGGITSVKPRRFLVRTSTVGYQLSVEENGNSCWMPIEIKPGEVLTTGIIYMDNKKNKNATQRNIFKRLLKQSKAKKEQDLKYLQCFDWRGQEIMIPLIMSGVFSPVGDASMANYDAVYELQDLIMAFGLPVNAQLIHINNKEEFRCPKGVIRLYGTREEEMVVVSRVGPSGSLFSELSGSEKFEIPVDQDVLFRRGVIKKTPAIKAKLVDVFQSHLPSKDNDLKIEDKGVQDMYIKSKTNDKDFKVRQHTDRRFSTPVTLRNKPVTANYTNLTTDKDAALISPHRPKTPTSPTGNDYHFQKSTFENPTIIDSTAVIYKSPTRGDSSISSDLHSSNPSQTPIKSSSQNPKPPSKISNDNVLAKDIALPERAPRELKKSKSTGILDKLSVRKVKKERAKLKELRSDDVFSRRIVRSQLSYRDFFNGLGGEDGEDKNDENIPSRKEDSATNDLNGHSQSQPGTTSTSTKSSIDIPESKKQHETDKSHDSSYNSLLLRRQSIQHRDLPPIPPDSPHDLSNSSAHHDVINESKDSLYEHLPPAPNPPSGLPHDDDEEDGYMMPIQLRDEQNIYADKYEVKMRKQKSSQQNSANINNNDNGRTRKTRSVISQDHHSNPNYQHEEGCPLDIDRLFSFVYSSNSKEMGDSRTVGTPPGHLATSTSQLYGPMARAPKDSDMPGYIGQIDHRFMDNLDLEMRANQHNSHQRMRQSRNMNANPNATIRSHNLRKMRPSALELFHFSDSFRDIRTPDDQEEAGRNPHDNFTHGFYDQSNFYSRPPLLNSRSMDVNSMPPHPNYYGHPYGYAESEPCFRQNHRSSVGGGGPLNEGIYIKQGDDSAISLCSRGDGGFPNESEYSYNEYTEHHVLDDGWTPPDSVTGMSVQEVAKSLRYIGMKDRVVLRFSNEQIDGSMLCTLDKKVLQEGFPELNALELKKILDFVQGWRPKKK